MDAFGGFRDERADAQVHRAHGGVFAAGTLAVTLARDDDVGKTVGLEF